jgi:hypothetical protein
MLNKEGNEMTKEEAVEMLEQVLATLAKNSVYNNRLVTYADALDRYIASIEEKEKEENSDETTVEEILDGTNEETE